MKREYNSSDRKKLRLKMSNVFGQEIQTLSTELQNTFLDDLITTFENRLSVLNRAQLTLEFEVAEGVKCETF